jgi:hypothetical protein
MRSSAFARWSGLAAALGGLVWTASWLLNGQTAEGNRAVLGLTEGNYRALLNPALLFFILGLVATYRRRGARFGRLGLVGLVVAFLGYTLFLVGNVVEFGLIGVPWQPDLGWAIVLPSFLVIPLGMLLLGVAAGRTGGLRRPGGTVMLVFGLLCAAAVVLAIAEMVACACGRADRGLWLLMVTIGAGWVIQGFLLWSDRAALAADRLRA